MTDCNLKYGLAILLVAVICIPSYSQKTKRNRTEPDTISVRAGQVMIFRDTVLVPTSDTIIVLPPGIRMKVKENPYSRSDKFYDSLNSLTYKNVLTRELHNFFIRSRREMYDSLETRRADAPYLPFVGKVVGNISIVKVDLLEGNVLDTAAQVSTGFGKLINNIHPHTRSRIIRNNLLFKPGDRVDPFLFGDNERILRNLGFFEDVRINMLTRIESPDTVDIAVVTKDVFPFGIDVSIGDIDKYDIAFFDRNFLGSGNRFEVKYRFKGSEDQPHGVEISHVNPNINGSFIRSELLYANTWQREGWFGELSRNFLSPSFRWGGGASGATVTQERGTKQFPNDTAFVEIPYKHNQLDFWLGRSFLLNQRTRRREVLLTAGTYFIDFPERPPVSIDSNRFYHDRNLYLSSISFTNRNFIKGHKIRSFGRTEDVPTGFQVEFTGGFEKGEFIDRPYFGFSAGIAEFFHRKGYIAVFGEIGGFTNDKVWEDAVLNLFGVYFTRLENLGRIQIRQFVEINYSKGLSDQAFFQYIDMRKFIRGISGNLDGDERLVLNLETNLFTNFYWVGFKIAFFNFIDLGLVGFEESLFKRENFYSGFGAGFRLRNESLVFRTIVVSLGYYPRSSTQGSQFNLDLDDSEPKLFRSFQVDKPQVVIPVN